MDKIQINLGDILLCLSNAQNIISPVVSKHHQQVAYLAYRLSEVLNLPTQQRKDIFLAALVHDMGALSLEEKLEIIESEPININHHAFKGAKLFESFGPLKSASRIIKYHHLPWNGGEGTCYLGEDVPVESHLIHLADRACIKIKPNHNVLSQIPTIIKSMTDKCDTVFVPEHVDALRALSGKEYIWLDLICPDPVKRLPDGIMNDVNLGMDDIIDLTSIFSHIIDFRSKFTSRHSAGVAKTAEKLAELVGFSPNECKKMRVAGYLHDLGKLAIDNEILEKPGGLNEDEFNEMRSHTYYTYYLLSFIPQFGEINTWAAFHHEKLDGTGYPFHLKGDSLSLGSRIMAVADVFTAITENRPYRKGMDDEQAIRVLNNMVANGALDMKIVNLLTDNFEEINRLRYYFQQEAGEYYDKFFKD